MFRHEYVAQGPEGPHSEEGIYLPCMLLTLFDSWHPIGSARLREYLLSTDPRALLNVASNKTS